MKDKRPPQVVIVPVAIPVRDPRRTELRGAAIVGGRTLRRPLLIRRADAVSGEIDLTSRTLAGEANTDTARIRRG